MSSTVNRVLIAGGGIAAVETLLALRAVADDLPIDATLVAPGDWLTYRPLAVLEPFGGAPARRWRLDAIAADLGATLRRDVVTGVDAAQRTVVTGGGERLPYDALVIATGGRAQPAVPGAHTFMPDDDPGSYGAIVRELEEGRIRRVAFVAPAASGWQLPLSRDDAGHHGLGPRPAAAELALTTARRARDAGAHPSLTLATPEEVPLAAFRGMASDAVARLLVRAGIDVEAGSYPAKVEHGALWLMPNSRRIEVDRVVALPRVLGPAIGGLPHDADGFVAVDGLGRVPGAEAVYAVGDAAARPLKQGGLAAEQADVVAALIARAFGASAEEPASRPVLRAVLFTGDDPLYLEASIAGGESVTSTASRESPWQPPDKIAARHLGPFLAQRTPEDPELPTPLDEQRRQIAQERGGEA